METHLIREIVSVKENFNVASLTNERLRLFSFATEHSWFSAIGDISLSITIHNLQNK